MNCSSITAGQCVFERCNPGDGLCMRAQIRARERAVASTIANLQRSNRLQRLWPYKEFTVTLMEEREKAVRVLLDGRAQWVPKSACDLGEAGEGGERMLAVKHWFCEKEGLAA